MRYQSRYIDISRNGQVRSVIIPSASAGSSPLTARPATVSDFGLGDDKTIPRVIEGVVSPLVRAQLVIKRDLADAGSNAFILKTITTALTSAGQITDYGAVQQFDGR